MEITPFFCHLSHIPGCFEEEEIIDIYLKTDLFQIEISKYLKVSNIRMIGNELILFKNLTCINEPILCCNDTANDVMNECNNQKNKINILEINFELSSLFILRPLQMAPEIMIVNVTFENINSIREDAGWRSLFLIYQKYYNISFINVRFYRCSLSHGFLYEKTYNFSESQSIQNKIFPFIRLLLWNNVNIEGDNKLTSFYFDNGLTEIPFSFFHFEFFEQILIQTHKMKVSSINMSDINKTVDYFIFDFDENSIIELNINELILQNIIGYGFVKMKNSLMVIKDFKISNCKIYQSSFFFLDKSILMLNLGLINEIEILLDVPFLICKNKSLLHFDSTYLQIFSNTFLKSDQSSLTFLNSLLRQIQLLNFNYFMIMVDSNLNITKTNIDNILLKKSSQSFIGIFSLKINIVLVYQKGLCLDVIALNFFLYQSMSLNVSMYLEIKEIEFVSIKGVNDFPDIRPFFYLLNSLSAIESILFYQIYIHNFDDFSLFQISAPYFNISVNEISLNSSNDFNSLLIQILISNEDNPYQDQFQSFLNINNFTILKVKWDLPIVFLNALTKNCTVSLKNCHFKNIFANSFFQFLSEENKLQILIENVNCFEIFKSFDDFLLPFLDLLYTSLSSLIISNITIFNCTTMNFVIIGKPFISIIINNLIVSQMNYNQYYFMRFGSSSQAENPSIKMSILQINNLVVKNSFFSPYPFSGIFDVKYPFFIQFQNISLENFSSWCFLFFQGTSKISGKLVFLDFTLMLKFYFFLIYCDSFFDEALIQNIFVFEASYITLIDLRIYFRNMLFKNIHVSNVDLNDYYLIICTQQQSKKNGEISILEITNTTFLNVGFDSSYYSPISLILVWDITNLNVSNFQLINVVMRGPDLKIDFLCLEVSNVQMVTINSFSFLQTVLINLDQVFKIFGVENFLKISNSRFEIRGKEALKKFQALIIIKCKYIEFVNNTVIGMSTLDRPQFIYEESGVLSFFADSSYVQNTQKIYFLFLKSKY